MSSSTMSRDVNAEVPRRIPPGVCAEASPETAFSTEEDSTSGTRYANKKRTVDGDTQKVTDLLNLATSQSKRSEVPQNKVVIGTTSLQLVTTLGKAVAQRPRVGNDLACVLLKLGLANLEERCRHRSDCL